MTPEEFARQWQIRHDEYQRLGVQVDGAKVIEAFLSDWHVLNREQNDELLTLERAAIESGFSKDYLGWLVRTGQVPNAGRLGAPSIRRRDLPARKKSPVARGRRKTYDVDADARTLRIPR